MKIALTKTAMNIMVMFVIALSAFVTPATPSFADTSADVSPSALLARQCKYGSKVWADISGYGIRISRENLVFDWCYDGNSASVLNTNHWFQITYPNTSVVWQNINVSDGGNGSKVIFANGEVQLCQGWCWRKYSCLKLQITKDGRVSSMRC